METLHFVTHFVFTFMLLQNFKVNLISLTLITRAACCSSSRRARATAEITAPVGGGGGIVFG